MSPPPWTQNALTMEIRRVQGLERNLAEKRGDAPPEPRELQYRDRIAALQAEADRLKAMSREEYDQHVFGSST